MSAPQLTELIYAHCKRAIDAMYQGALGVYPDKSDLNAAKVALHYWREAINPEWALHRVEQQKEKAA